MAKLTGHSYRVLYLAMSPDGEAIVTGAGDETLRFWNVFRWILIHFDISLLSSSSAKIWYVSVSKVFVISVKQEVRKRASLPWTCSQASDSFNKTILKLSDSLPETLYATKRVVRYTPVVLNNSFQWNFVKDNNLGGH